MPLTIGVLKETFPGEHRVAVAPRAMDMLAKSGVQWVVEAGAGTGAGFADKDFQDKGAKIASRSEVFETSDVLIYVRTGGSNPEAGKADIALFSSRHTIIGFCDPLDATPPNQEIAARGANLLAMELMPRITRAQSMDALSSMATIAGYKAVLLAAARSTRMFPMLTTAAGTVAPAKVFVLGAGVAGLQAIATARRLGAVVSAYDVREAAQEQIQSLGARPVTMKIEGSAEGQGGYAKAMDEEFYRRQRELLTEVVRDQDVAITTAAVPGQRAPILITAGMVRQMAAGSIIVDLGAERGGNCELTKPGQEVVENGVLIIGTTNLASSIPHHASQMYGRNVATFLKHLIKDGKLEWDLQDEITRETLVARGGEIVHARVRDAFGLGGQKPA